MMIHVHFSQREFQNIDRLFDHLLSLGQKPYGVARLMPINRLTPTY